MMITNRKPYIISFEHLFNQRKTLLLILISTFQYVKGRLSLNAI